MRTACQEVALSWSVLVASIFLPVNEAFCPVGFGNMESFPKEWKIPEWPKDMLPLQAAALRTVTLGGFLNTKINEEYLEGPTEDFLIQGYETYWQASGEYFLYFCQRYQKWRIAGINAFSENKDGQCFSFVSDGYPKRDLRNKTYIKGWIEVVEGQWEVREEAGVVHLGTLAEQIAAMDASEDVAEGSEEACDSEEGEGGEEGEEDASPFKEKKRKGNCPLRKAGEKLKEVAVQVGKWVRRLFPKLLGAPQEDAEETQASQEEVEQAAAEEAKVNEAAKKNEQEP